MTSFNRIFLKTSRLGISSHRAICSQRLLNISTCLWCGSHQHKHQIRSFMSDKSMINKLISQSSIIVQDGIHIEELPILVKIATQESLSLSYPEEKVQEKSEFDTSFQQVLQNCNSVNEVFRLLEVPQDKVKGYSAAFALQRLHVLKKVNTDWNQIHSFIRSAVMRDLYDTVQKDVRHLSNSVLVSLVECYLAAEGFSASCINAINAEIHSRLGDSEFSIDELLTLANILKSCRGESSKQPPFFSLSKSPNMSIVSENASRLLSNDDDDERSQKAEHFDTYSAKANQVDRVEMKIKYQEMLNNVWVNLTSRYSEINKHTLPHVLQALQKENKHLVPLLEKSVTTFWADLSAESVGMCLDSLVRLSVYNATFLTYLGRWAYVNIHKMTPPLLLSFLNTFMQLGCLDENLIMVIEKCLHLKGNLVQTDVVAMCVEYCRSCRYLSPLVMDVAANHFTQHAYSYHPLQLFAVLRAFGQLGYLPAKSSAFLKQVESCLQVRFEHLDKGHLLEILGSFTFINFLPQNFLSRITSPAFYTRLRELKNTQIIPTLMWLKVVKHAVALNASTDSSKKLHWVLSRRSRLSFFLHLDSHRVAIKCLNSAIDRLLGGSFYHVLPFYGCCVIYLDKDRMPLPIKVSETFLRLQGEVGTKLAIILRSGEHFTVNTKHLLGAQVQRLKHLKTLGFTPVEIQSSKFMYMDQLEKRSDEFLKTQLSPYINFSKAAQVSIPSMTAAKIDEKDIFRDWLASDENFSSDDEVDSEAQNDLNISGEGDNLTKNDPDDDDEKDPK